MAKKRKKSPKRLAPELAHDDREIAVGTVVRYSAMLLLATGVVLAVMWPITLDWRAEEKSTYDVAPPVASDRPVFPEQPRLQRLPREGLAYLREQEAEQLSSYAWIDKERRIARIPIDVAMDVLGKNRLEARPQGPPDTGNAAVPNEASLDPGLQEGWTRPW